MNRKFTGLIVALLALAALEFRLLGASASGLGGGSGRVLPPVAERGNARATPTPVARPARSASIELDQPAPPAIRCNGSDASSLRVSVRDADGHTVKDGTPVHFSVFNGSATPSDVPTSKGSASTSVVIYSDAYSLQPNVEVRTGDIEAAIRVRCMPDSGCPLSPPPSASPPCGSPTPTPFPCNPSPGSGPLSPPCAPPPAPPTSGTGGEIYIGTPELINGKIRVSVSTTQAPDPYSGFNMHLVFDGSPVHVASRTDFASGGALEANGAATLCFTSATTAPPDQNGDNGFAAGCVILGVQSVSGAGTLAFLWLTPTAASGCARLHLVSYGPPDGGDVLSGTFTMNDEPIAAQANTYGPDVYVNIADGSACGPTLISTTR